MFKIIAKNIGIEPEFFSKFMIKRFPDVTDKLYIQEWAERFKSGNPIAFMDSQSKQAYIECINEW